MKIYQGIVEDIDDPLKVNRVKVRVFGLHSDDRNLIPVEALPWATVAMTTASASMSGIGQSPSGLLPGSWVGLYFLDVDEQYPVVLFSLHGVPEDPSAHLAADEDVEFSDSEAPREENVLKDSSGTPVTDSSGEPIKTTPTVDPEKPSAKNAKVIPSELGSISKVYESGNRGPGAINNYSNGKDLGGASYGLYQFASYLKGPGIKTRDSVTSGQIANSPIKQYLRGSTFASSFLGLEPATPQFDAMWKSIGASNKNEFAEEQHAYIERNYYQIAANRLPASITNRGKAVHEAIWSMSVQLGPGGCASKINKVCGSIDTSVCDDKFVDILYTSRIETVQTDFKSSPSLWGGLTSRFEAERTKLIALAKTYETSDCGAVTETEEKKVEYQENNKKVVTTQPKVVATPNPSTKGERGFSDPSKKYPLYYNEADTHRLSRGVVTGTIVEPKRSGVVTGKSAGDATISEPTTQYNTKYPFNKVHATSSGHVIEYDDTPGYERLHVYHKSGTFIEMHPDGKLVTKVRGNNTLVVNADNNTIVLDNSNTHVDGNDNKTVNGNLTLVVHGNINVTADGNCTIKAATINLNP